MKLAILCSLPLLLLLLVGAARGQEQYVPVVILHGVLGSAAKMEPIKVRGEASPHSLP